MTKYQLKRISDSTLDRIDIHIEVPRVDYENLNGDRLCETSEMLRKRVGGENAIQLKLANKQHNQTRRKVVSAV